MAILQVITRPPRIPSFRGALICATAATFAVSAAGCGSHSQAVAASTSASPATPEPGRPDPATFLRSDRFRKVAELQLLAGLGSSNNGYNFDGYGRGELLASVPRGWRVTIRCEDHGSRRSSCAVVTGARSATLAFPRASVPDPVQGLSPGASAQFTFTASHTGVFRIVSLVPGQSEARMYAVLQVTRGGRPSVTARPGP